MPTWATGSSAATTTPCEREWASVPCTTATHPPAHPQRRAADPARGRRHAARRCEWCSEFTFYKVPQTSFLPVYVPTPHHHHNDNVTLLVLMMALMGGAIAFLAVKFVRKL